MYSYTDNKINDQFFSNSDVEYYKSIYGEENDHIQENYKAITCKDGPQISHNSFHYYVKDLKWGGYELDYISDAPKNSISGMDAKANWNTSNPFTPRYTATTNPFKNSDKFRPPDTLLTIKYYAGEGPRATNYSNIYIYFHFIKSGTYNIRKIPRNIKVCTKEKSNLTPNSNMTIRKGDTCCVDNWGKAPEVSAKQEVIKLIYIKPGYEISIKNFVIKNNNNNLIYMKDGKVVDESSFAVNPKPDKGEFVWDENFEITKVLTPEERLRKNSLSYFNKILNVPRHIGGAIRNTNDAKLQIAFEYLDSSQKEIRKKVIKTDNNNKYIDLGVNSNVFITPSTKVLFAYNAGEDGSLYKSGGKGEYLHFVDGNVSTDDDKEKTKSTDRAHYSRKIERCKFIKKLGVRAPSQHVIVFESIKIPYKGSRGQAQTIQTFITDKTRIDDIDEFLVYEKYKHEADITWRSTTKGKRWNKYRDYEKLKTNMYRNPNITQVQSEIYQTKGFKFPGYDGDVYHDSCNAGVGSRLNFVYAIPIDKVYNKLKTQLTDTEKQLTEKTNKIKELEEEIQTKTDTIRKLEENIIIAKKQSYKNTITKNEIIEQLKKELKDTKASLETSEIELKDALVSLETSEIELKDTKASLETSEKELLQSLSTISNLEKDLDDTKKTLEDTKASLEASKKDLEDVTNAKKQAKTDLAEAIKTKKDTEDKLEAAENNLEIAEGTLKSAISKIEELVVSSEEDLGKITAAEKSKQEAEDKLYAAVNSKQEAEKSKQEAEDKLEIAEDELDAAEKSRQEAENLRLKAENLRLEAEKKLAAAVKSKQEAVNSRLEAEKKYETAEKSRIQAVKDKNSVFATDSLVKSAQKREAAAEKSKQEAISKLTTAKEKLKAAEDDLKGAKEKAKEDLEEAQTNLAQAQKDLEEAKNNLAQTKTKLANAEETAEKSKQEAEKKLKAAIESKNEADGKLATAKEQNKTLEGTITKLREMIVVEVPEEELPKLCERLEKESTLFQKYCKKDSFSFKEDYDNVELSRKELHEYCDKHGKPGQQLTRTYRCPDDKNKITSESSESSKSSNMGLFIGAGVGGLVLIILIIYFVRRNN